jgi:para-nitrobenzyl esterase
MKRELSSLIVLGASIGLASGSTQVGVPGAAAARTPPVVETRFGRVQGARVDGHFEVRGIPYAQAPVGALRWRVAQAPARWRGVRLATAFGPVCPQPILDPPRFRYEDLDEDCLHLNIMSPDIRPQARLPVMVWIHGGANYLGSGRDEFEQAGIFVRRGVVFVSFNYRLGRFAFFAHPALAALHPGEAGDNFGLSDQIAALRWLRQNVRLFGGDPSNITIFGVSSGGTSVNSLVASPLARGLFAKAIAQSTGALLNTPRPIAAARAEALRIAALHGVTGTGASELARLQRLSFDEILALEPRSIYRASVDGHILTEDMPQAFANGHLPEISYIWGSVSDEGSVYRGSAFSYASVEGMTGFPLEDFRSAYDPAGTMGRAELLAYVQADTFGSGVAMAAFANRAGRPTWVYRFQYLPAAMRDRVPGVHHGGDVPYLFGTMPNATPEDVRISSLLQSYWINFARSGNPNGPGLPAWPRYRTPSPRTLVIDERSRAVADFRGREMSVWFELWRRRMGSAVPQ